MPRLQITDYRLQIRNVAIKIFLFSVLCSLFSVNGYAQEKKEEPIIVNGDTVEYSTDAKEVTATGNVSVIYKGSKLTCQKLTVNTQTKDAEAEGNARLDDKKGIVEGTKIKYNFQTKTGTIIDSKFRANPYFGKAEKVEKLSDSEFVAKRGYFTSCNYDNPHYRIKSRKINIFPGDKVQTKDDIFYTGRVPLFYLPRYNHSLKDPLMHVQLMPGKNKNWGPYVLSAWRYNLTDNLSGRIYFDYREKLGVAEGFGTSYTTEQFGKGDFKYYYTQERDHTLPKENRNPRIFQRYFIRWRHKWVIDKQTDLTSEYYKIVDSKMAVQGSQYNILKDYFFREYEKDSQPLSYTLLHHSFNYSSLDFLMQKRTNRWYASYLEKLPEIKYTLSSFQIAESPFYINNDSSVGNFNKKNTSTMTPTANDTTPDTHVNRLDTSNKLSLPMKVAFISFTPFVMNRETFYDHRAVGSSSAPRTIFYSGADMSTKFYRIFNVKSNFLRLDINGLRHIITPTISYSFNHEPTVSSSKLRQIDGVESINRNNSASLGLSNKLQTKRNGQSVDALDFNVTNTYYFINPETYARRGGGLSDFFFDLKLLPYSWMRIDADATYTHSGARSSASYNRFSNANYDLNFVWADDRSFGIGQRYQLKGGNEITYSLKWRLNPKWKFSAYQRYYRGHETNRARGLREQEYSISRDLHCWTWDITYNVKRGYGESIWFVFRLKAFPELEFNFDQNYHQPKPGSQSESVVR